MPRDERLTDPTPEAAHSAAESIFDRRVGSVTPIAEGVNALFQIELEDRTVVLKTPTIATDEEFLVEPVLLGHLRRDTAVPVPQVLAEGGAEQSPLDTAFYVMEFIDGRQIPSLLELPPASRERLVQEAGAHLAAIHELRLTEAYGHLRFVDGELTVKPAFRSWAAFFDELVGQVTAGLLGEGQLTDAEPRFADLEPTIRATLADHPLADSSPQLAIVTGDYRPTNLVLAARNEADQLVQGVVDVGGFVGDPLLDVAMTEDALISTPLGGTGGVESLRTTFRTAYANGRDAEPESLFDERYPYYRLYARAERLAAFEYTSEFARETDPDSIAHRWRSFVANRVEELRGRCR